MATRQYIGARYVTKVYENSVDNSSAEWESGVTYDPLTLVTYNYSSYLSKKLVPGSVGDPASNPNYWVITGAYNGQIAYLQNEIDNIINNVIPALSDDITQLKKPYRVVFIGDSYGSVLNYAFPKYLADALGTTIDTDFFYHAEGGSGFIGNGTANTYLDQFQLIENNITDPDTITDVIVCGGINDNSSNLYTIMAAVKSFIDYVKTVCVNAVVHVGYVSRSSDHSAIYGHYDSTLKAYKNGAIAYGGAFIENSPVMINYEALDTDMLHPTNDGCKHLGWGMASYLFGSTCTWQAGTNALTATFDQTGISSSSGLSVKMNKLHNSNWNVQIGEALFGLTGATGNFFQSGKKIASFSQGYIDAVDYNTGSISTTILVKYNDGTNDLWMGVPASLMIKMDGVYLKFHSDYMTINYPMLQIYWQPFNTILDSFTC